MFIEKLTITSKNMIVREMHFKNGMNLIIDETPNNNDLRITGNNVGKTTVLKLVYFCLGANYIKINSN